MMRAALVAAALLLSCARSDSSADKIAAARSARESAQVTQRMKAIEADLLAAQKQLIAEQQKSEELRRRIVTIESFFADRLAAADPATAVTAPAIVANDPPKRAGFTDFGQSVRNPPRIEAGTTSSPQSSSRATANADPSWNDVAKASDFYDASNVITGHCSREWPNDARMFNYCVEKQSVAVATLKQGRPFGADEPTFNRARVSCASQWPTDYAMRVYCESKTR